MNGIVSTEEPALVARHFRHIASPARGLSDRRAEVNAYARLQAEDVVELCALGVLFACVLVSIVLAAESVILFLASIHS